MRGKRLPRGALDGAVRDVLWEDGRWLIPAEVHAKLPTGGDLSSTTVMTTLARLQRKGRLDRRKDRRAFAYHLRSTRAEWAGTHMDEVLNLTGERTATLANFFERLSESDLTELRRIPSDRESR
jgi:predicted transcriptional regulator